MQNFHTMAMPFVTALLCSFCGGFRARRISTPQSYIDAVSNPGLVLFRSEEKCKYDEKTLIATRHAEARHNVAEAWSKAGKPGEFRELNRDEISALREFDNVIDYEGFLDAPLSDEGVRAVSDARDKLRRDLEDLKLEPDVVYVSTLRRTLLTSAILYGGWYPRPLYATDLIVEKRTQAAADTRRSLLDVEAGLKVDVSRGSDYWEANATSLKFRFANPYDELKNGRTYVEVDLKDGHPRPFNPVDWSSVSKGVYRQIPEVWGGPVDGGLVRDMFYFGKLQQVGERPSFAGGRDKGNRETLRRAIQTLDWLRSLPFSTVGLVSHKGFLRELEIAGGLYEDLEHDDDNDKEKLRMSIKALKENKTNVTRREEVRAWGEYGNAETRIYCLRQQ